MKRSKCPSKHFHSGDDFGLRERNSRATKWQSVKTKDGHSPKCGGSSCSLAEAVYSRHHLPATLEKRRPIKPIAVTGDLDRSEGVGFGARGDGGVVAHWEAFGGCFVAQGSSAAASGGAEASFVDRSGSVVVGQTIPMDGSSHRMPRSALHDQGAVTL